MLKAKTLLTTLATLAVGSMGIGLASAFTGEELAKDAKVTMDQATAIALKARAGTVTDKELEKEEGGSGLRYSFDIKSEKITYEVGVDANTGDVLENAAEGAHPD